MIVTYVIVKDDHNEFRDSPLVFLMTLLVTGTSSGYGNLNV